MDSRAHLLPLWTFVVKPPLLRPVSSWYPLFDPAGMLVDFDRGAVQHQRCFVHQILLHQGCEDIFLLSRHGTGCTHFAMARTAPADPSMVFRCSANTGLR